MDPMAKKNHEGNTPMKNMKMQGGPRPTRTQRSCNFGQLRREHQEKHTTTLRYSNMATEKGPFTLMIYRFSKR